MKKEVEWTVVNGGWFMDYFVQGSRVGPTALLYSPSSNPTTTSTGEPSTEEKPKWDPSIIRSYLKPLPGVWPLDMDTFHATLLGTGNEPIGWTSARDVAKTLIKLIEGSRGNWHME